MNAFTNDWLLEASRWLWDYCLLATVLLMVVLIVGKLIAQPARRMAIHWSATAGLMLLALLCAVPGWSVVHMLSATPAPPILVSNAEPIPAPAIQLGPGPSQPLPPRSLVTPVAPPVSATAVAAEDALVIDYGALLPCVLVMGSLAFALWLVLGTWQVRRLRSRAKPAPAELVELMKKIGSSD